MCKPRETQETRPGRNPRLCTPGQVSGSFAAGLLQVASSRLPAPTPELFIAAGLAAADITAQAGAPRAASEEIQKRAADQAAALRWNLEVSSSAKAVSPKRRNGLAAFRAVEDEVHAALSAGRTVLAIYEKNRDRLAMSYAQFARYAQPLRRALKAQPPAARALPAVPPSIRPVAERRTPPAVGTGPPKGRPEDAVPSLDMDGFAAQALKKKDLF